MPCNYLSTSRLLGETPLLWHFSMSVMLGVLHQVWKYGRLQCQDFLCSGLPDREPCISGQSRGRGKNYYQALVGEAVDPAGVADEQCGVCEPNLAYEGNIRAKVHVGQSMPSASQTCHIYYTYANHLCRSQCFLGMVEPCQVGSAECPCAPRFGPSLTLTR